MKRQTIVKCIKTILRYNNVHWDSGRNVLIFSIPRSGSTWLMELIWSQPGFKTCNEPLNLRYEQICGMSGISGFEELYQENVLLKLNTYFKGLANSDYKYFNPHPFSRYYKPITNRTVFKVINGAEEYVNEISRVTNSKVIYLIRHPIATTLSRKVLPRLNLLCSERNLADFSLSTKRRIFDILDKGGHLEKGVLSWCLQNHLALKNKNNDWMIFTYEQLAVNPGPIIDKLALEMELPDKERIFKRLSRASKTTVQSDTITKENIENTLFDRNELIERWREKVSKSKAESLFRIIKMFNLDIYSMNSSYPKRYIIK